MHLRLYGSVEHSWEGGTAWAEIVRSLIEVDAYGIHFQEPVAVASARIDPEHESRSLSAVVLADKSIRRLSRCHGSDERRDLCAGGACDG